MVRPSIWLIENKYGPIPARLKRYADAIDIRLYALSRLPVGVVTRKMLQKACRVNGRRHWLEVTLAAMDNDGLLEVRQRTHGMLLRLGDWPELIDQEKQRQSRYQPADDSEIDIEKEWKKAMYKRLHVRVGMTNKDRANYLRTIETIDAATLVAMFAVYWESGSPYRQHPSFTEFYNRRLEILDDWEKRRDFEYEDRYLTIKAEKPGLSRLEGFNLLLENALRAERPNEAQLAYLRKQIEQEMERLDG